ncbi:MAG TPA: glycoside hydrolase family 19 protein [Halomicronema sp.]
MSCTVGRSYIVEAEDTPYKIAQQQLGDGNRWHEIKKPDGNSLTENDANNLQPGQEICIPNGSVNLPGGNGLASIISAEIYEAMFPNRNALYTYDSLVTATQKYPEFCNEGSDEQRKQEAAAFLANIAHETTGGWDAAPGGRFAWGLHFIEEQNPTSQYCDPSNPTYACAPGRSYHGRGPIQLSWNYNYGQVGQTLGIDLLNNPDLVKTDGVIAFQTALWFWMTPQPPKPSCHAVMTGGWTPSADDASKGRAPGFGMTINIINGGLECSIPTNDKVNDRVGFYKRFSEMLGVSMGESIYCENMAHY